MSTRTDHPLYDTWRTMRMRCNNPNNKMYHYYGGRGISICKRWDDFFTFVEDMGPRPNGHTIDRINNDGNHEPSNCRWATKSQQQHNSKQTKLTEQAVIEIRNGTKPTQYFVDKYGISAGSVYNIRYGSRWKDVRP